MNQKGSVWMFILMAVLMTIAIGGGIYWAQTINKKVTPDAAVIHLKQITDTEQVTNPQNNVGQNQIDMSNWRTYTNVEYGYSVKYPSSLTQKEAQKSDIYLSQVSFTASDTSNDRFSIMIRKSTLQEEISYQKSQIEGHIPAKLTKNTETIIDNFSGVILEYTPDNSDIGTVTRFIIVNNGKYSYTISGTPKILDQILSTFSFN